MLITVNRIARTLLFAVAAFTGPPWRQHAALCAEVEGEGGIDDTAVVEEPPSFRLGEIEDEMGYEMTLVGYPPDDKLIHRSESKYQTIEVYRHEKFGRILVLDGCVQLTEKDANSYNEMLAHVPMFAYGEGGGPTRVLVIGGGDGYVVSEVLKHKSVAHVDHVELDEGVIRACKEHFVWGKAWEDPRVTVHISDGAAFLRDAPASTYDVIIQDSSDPFYLDEDTDTVVELPSHVLYEPAHFANARRALTDGGVFAFQAETYNIPSSLNGAKEWRRAALGAGFVTVRYGTIATGSYPMGQIGFLLCGKKEEGGEGEASSHSSSIVRRFVDLEEPTTYYHPRMQQSCFDLPLWVEHEIYGQEHCNAEYIAKDE